MFFLQYSLTECVFWWKFYYETVFDSEIQQQFNLCSTDAVAKQFVQNTVCFINACFGFSVFWPVFG